MSHGDKDMVNPIAGLVVAGLMLLMAVSVLVVAQGFSGGSGLFPRFIGWIFVGLAGAELLLQLKGFLITGKKQPVASNQDDSDAKLKLVKEIKGLLWLVVLLAGVYVAGFMVTLPVYLFTFMRFSGNRSIKESTLISVGSTAFVDLLFVVLLDYKLYPGILLGA